MARDYSAADLMPAAVVFIIGIAEASHLCGVFFDLPFHFCTLAFGVSAAAGILLLAVSAAVYRVRRKEKLGFAGPGNGAEGLLLVIFFAILLSQLVFVLTNRTVYRQGDMTVETVGSFLETNAIYQVNPITGQAYQQGIPSRLKILCLPTLYGALCSLTHLPPQRIVWRVAPILTLLGCYGAYSALGSCFFGNDRKKRSCFLIAVSLLLWAGSYLYGMDGFGVLYAGWRGVTIRNAVLIPWVVSLCLRRKWVPVLLCILAEACAAWTLYGMGACLFITVGIVLTDVIRAGVEAKRAAGEEAAK